jgi:hypothetical protein
MENLQDLNIALDTGIDGLVRVWRAEGAIHTTCARPP